MSDSTGTPSYMKATERQLDVIEETQQQVDVDFSKWFPELTVRQADVLCKGLIALSEIIRQTGKRSFRLGDLRRAIRNFIRENDIDGTDTNTGV